MKAFATIMLLALQVMCASSEAASTVTSGDEAALAAMLQSRSLAELARATSDVTKKMSRSSECEAELAHNVIPRSCFGPDLQSNHQNWLTKECVRRAKTSSSRRDLNQSNTDLPEICRLAAAERLADLDYLSQSERPSEVWTTWTRN